MKRTTAASQKKAPVLSALHRGARPRLERDEEGERKPLSDWVIDESHLARHLRRKGHPLFNEEAGLYIVAKDALHLVQVEVRPKRTGVKIRRWERSKVAFWLKLEQPKSEANPEVEFRDVGAAHFGELVHLREGTTVSVCGLAEDQGKYSVKLTIEVVQRKRLRSPSPPPLKRKRRRIRTVSTREKMEASNSQNDDSDKSGDEPALDELEDTEDVDSEWSRGFTSDSTTDELHESGVHINRLANKLNKVLDT